LERIENRLINVDVIFHFHPLVDAAISSWEVGPCALATSTASCSARCAADQSGRSSSTRASMTSTSTSTAQHAQSAASQAAAGPCATQYGLQSQLTWGGKALA
jgi:hypothetical protein